MADFRHNCASCEVRPQCEYTFGAYYADKSANVAGCNHRINTFNIERVKRCASAVHTADSVTIIGAAAIDNGRTSKADILERLKRMRRS